jgi:REP element-mobilizing transposase RayT
MHSKYKKLSHVVYKCDYHIVWTPKYRFRVLFGEVKFLVERDIRMLCEWKGVEVIELNVQIDHVHIVCSIPPKVSVSELLGTLKGKLASPYYLFINSHGCNHLLRRWLLSKPVPCSIKLVSFYL